MRRRTHTVFLGGATVAMAALAWLNHNLEQRKETERRIHSDQVAARLCNNLQAIYYFYSSDGRVNDPQQRGWLSSLGLELEALQIASGEALKPRSDRKQRGAYPKGSHISFPCMLQGPLIPLEFQSTRHRPDVLWLAPKAVKSQGWIRLDGRKLVGSDPNGPKVRIVAPWDRFAIPQHGNNYLYRVTSGGEELALELTPASSLQDGLERSLILTLSCLGLVVSGSLAYLFGETKRKQEVLIGSWRTDHQTSLLSRYALISDLEHQQAFQGDLHHPLPQAFLVTIDFRFLERQRAFLSEEELVRVLNVASDALQKFRQHDANLRLYRISEHKIAILLLPSIHVPSLEAEAGEALLHELKHAALDAAQNLLRTILNADDILIAGQYFRPESSVSSLMAMQAFGELLAAEKPVAVHLVEPGDDHQIRNKAEIKSQIKNLRAEDIELRFQPILLISNPGKFGVELLIRFRSPVLKRLGTGRVMEVAHDIGVAHQIDELVLSRLAEVQHFLMDSKILRDAIEYISVNISGDSVSSEKRLSELLSQLGKYRVDNKIFCIEITEMAATDILAGPASVKTASERLIKELGMRVFIDDFGSGLSNYRRICEAWYDAIKLDIGLVKGISRSFRLQRYVGSFINAVHALGKTVVCEGVENFNDLTVAMRLGTDALQGYLISPPLDLAGLESFLRSSEWASRIAMEKLFASVNSSARLLTDSEADEPESGGLRVALERYILDNWSRLRSFEEFVLIFVNELKGWGLDLYRFSLAFLPDQDDIDCSQYVWFKSKPGEVTTLRMERDFLEREEHLSSPLHYIATKSRMYRQQPGVAGEHSFPFLEFLKSEGCTDYLGIRLESRGVSIPVLTIALHGGSTFSDEQIQRIESMSSLLSLLFYAFESERSKRLALLDPLTLLSNRRSFDSFLKANIASCHMSGTPLALALIDIDRFKAVNDTMGHGYGDECLRRVAAALNASLQRKNDFVARLGGEEFAIILPAATADQAFSICEKVRQAVLDANIRHPDVANDNRLSVSIGIAVWESPGQTLCDADGFQQLADDSLYEAKRTGRNRVVCRSLIIPA
jgi:diguanylate cyclase (GGDEF)-like protein